jgi:small subunit ribosomal protein S18
MASEVTEEVKGERSGAGGGDKKRSLGRRKMCKFCADETIKIDYKDAGLLKYFITDRGKLVPRRLSGNCAKHQREISTAVNRARMIALMPFAVTGA